MDHVTFDCELVREICVRAGITSFLIKPKKLRFVGNHNKVDLYVWALEGKLHFVLTRDVDKVRLKDQNAWRESMVFDLAHPLSIQRMANFVLACEWKDPKRPPPEATHGSGVIEYGLRDDGEVGFLAAGFKVKLY